MPIADPAGYGRDYFRNASMAVRQDRRMRLGPPQVDPHDFLCGKSIHLYDGTRGSQGPMVEYRSSEPCRLPVNHDGVCEPVLRRDAEVAAGERDSAEQALAEARQEVRALQELLERLTPDADADADACLVLARMLADAGMDRDAALEVATAAVDVLRPVILGLLAAEPDDDPPANGAVRRLLVDELKEIQGQARRQMTQPVTPVRSWQEAAQNFVVQDTAGSPLCGPPNGRSAMAYLDARSRLRGA